jgi:hypothetical protein
MDAAEPVYAWPVPGILIAAARDTDPSADIAALLAELPPPLILDAIKGLAVIAVAGWMKAGRLAGLDDDAIVAELQALALELASG